MLSIFIMLFVAIGVAAGIGYSIITLINTAQMSLTIQQTQIRMQNIANSVSAGLTVEGHDILVPVKTLEESGSVSFVARLPASSPFSTTSTGADVVFCPALSPASNSMGPVSSMSNPDTDETFNINAVELAGKFYVKAGRSSLIAQEGEQESARQDREDTLFTRTRAMGMVAYLLSPQPAFTGNLSCGGIRLAADNYTLLVDGGSVIPIFGVSTDAKSSVFVLSGDGEIPSGYNGTDRVVRTINDVSGFIGRYQLADTTVRLPPSLSVKVADFEELLSAAKGRRLRLEPGLDASGNPVTSSTLSIDADGSATPSNNRFFSVSGDFHIKGVSFVGTNQDFDVAFDVKAGSDLILTDTSLAGIRTSGGNAVLEGSTVVHPSYGDDTTMNPVYAQGGEITIASTGVPAIDAPAAVVALRANAGTINLSQGTRINLAASSILSATQNRGRVSIPTDDIDAVTSPTPSTTPSALVSRDGAQAVAEAISTRETAEQACNDGDTECTAVCLGGKTVISGGCSTSNGTPLASFGLSAENSYSCVFSTLLPTQEPKATAVCDYK